MDMEDADWYRVYQEQLKLSSLPLWNPQPSSSANCNFFNALTKDDKYRGNAEPLVIDPSTDIKRVERPAVPICPDIVQVVNTTADSTFVIYSFESTSPSGAVLVPLTPLEEGSLLSSKEGELKRYLVCNLDDWPDHEVCSKCDMLLVYNYLLVHEWVMVVFEMTPREDGKRKFQTRIAKDADPRDGVWALDGYEFSRIPYFHRGGDMVSIMRRQGRKSFVNEPATPSHCVFLRGYQATRNRGVLG